MKVIIFVKSPSDLKEYSVNIENHCHRFSLIIIKKMPPSYMSPQLYVLYPFYETYILGSSFPSVLCSSECSLGLLLSFITLY